MERIRAHLVSADIVHKELKWAFFCTAFFGFFRLGELLPESRAKINPAASLMWGDVAVDSREKPSMVRFHQKQSKCDQFGTGADIIVGSTGSPIVPSNSNPQIHCGEGPRSRGVLQAGCHAASSESMVHRATTGDPNSGRPSPTAVCRTQLPDWRGYYGCHRRGRGLHYPDTVPLAQRGVSPVHQATQRAASQSLSS